MKVAAIWARVSTSDQRELSLDGQMERCRAKLEAQGYQVPGDLILKVDWTSLDLYSCPQFQQLLGWVKGREIAALGVLDRDRLAAQGLQRLIFLADCKAAGVELVVCQGHAVLDEPEGQLVELALAIGKERSIRRAQQGARDGLRDRATIKHLPPSPRNPYGYAWTADREALEPTAEWPHARLICRKALEGTTLGAIRQELHRRGTASPTGREWWARNALYTILINPVYGGRFYALRWGVVEPHHRRGNSYGKSSCQRKPLSEAQHLSNIVVKSPPLTWAEWEAIQERLHRNKELAQRHAKRDYLLRGLILCETHRRHYHGQPHHAEWSYTCPAHYEKGGQPCVTPYLNGPEVEARVKAICQDILTKPEIIEAEIEKRTGQVGATLKAIERKRAALSAKETKAEFTETNLLVGKASGDASPEAYDRALALIRAQKVWIAEERERLQRELAVAQQHRGVVLGLAQARERLLSLLERGTVADWREVLTALDVEVRVGDDGKVEVCLAIPAAQVRIESKSPGSLS